MRDLATQIASLRSAGFAEMTALVETVANLRERMSEPAAVSALPSDEVGKSIYQFLTHIRSALGSYDAITQRFSLTSQAGDGLQYQTMLEESGIQIGFSFKRSGDDLERALTLLGETESVGKLVKATAEFDERFRAYARLSAPSQPPGTPTPPN